MDVVRNNSRRPIQVQLGGGKVLHLGPGGTGTITHQAAERPAFRKLVEQGDIEVLADGEAAGSGGGQSGRLQESNGHRQNRIQRKGIR